MAQDSDLDDLIREKPTGKKQPGKERPEFRLAELLADMPPPETCSVRPVLTLSTGVRLRIKPASAWAIQEVTRRIERPEPPVKFLADKEREEVDYEDRDYLKALEAHASRVIQAATPVIRS